LLHQLGDPRVLLKLDLTRAFDSLAWPFLLETLRQYGFGNRFMEWISILLSSASTRVLMNGEPGPPIWHRKGLRQGDPVSPQLFVLAVDTLARLIKRVVDMGIMAQLHPTRSIPAVSLYANDAVLFCHCSPSDIIAVREVLALFGRTSGLMVNYAKSSASLLHCDTDEAT
uniref:Reverse transcriptase domain-containing protein n=1 Tax=Aegilops tauschii subsp. strangulata TaxID=200361 RepID=A0A453BHJ3_AEGTS